MHDKIASDRTKPSHSSRSHAFDGILEARRVAGERTIAIVLTDWLPNEGRRAHFTELLVDRYFMWPYNSSLVQTLCCRDIHYSKTFVARTNTV